MNTPRPDMSECVYFREVRERLGFPFRNSRYSDHRPIIVSLPLLTDMTVTNITENTATLGWKPVPGITNYIVRYRPSFVSSYVTRNIQDLSGSGNPLHVDIIGLTCGFSYDFNIESDCGSG